jgi:inner membrane transporter RhtA
MEHAASVSWVRSRSGRAHTSWRAPGDGQHAASRLGGPLLVLASSASLQSSAAMATTVFAVYGPLGTGALRFALASPVLLLVARPVLDGMSIAIAVAACLTLPVAVPAALATDAAHELALVAAVAVLGLAVPYALEYVAIRRVTVRTFSVLLSLDPAIAALAGVLWLGQRLGGSETIGIGLVVLASIGVMVTRRH